MTHLDEQPAACAQHTPGLRSMMAEHGLTYREVATLACVSVKTVESWLADPKSAMFRKMPPRHLLSMAHQLPGLLARRRTAARAAKKWNT